MTSTKTAAETLRGLMAMQSKSQKELSESLGISRATASSYMNGAAAMNTDTIGKLAEWLNVHPAIFLTGINTEYAASHALAA